jgi:hypothetical protein
MKNLVPTLIVLISACGEDLLPPSPAPLPPPPPLPPLLSILSGNSQQGTVGAFLDPFVVRVSSPAGAALASVPVTWAIVTGAGELGLPSVTYTSADGVATMPLRPTAPGWIQVIATAAGVRDSPATFAVYIRDPRAPIEVVIRFGPNFDCGMANDPSYFQVSEEEIPAGSTVIWESVWCDAQLLTVSVPPGAQPFDSGIIKASQRWAVVLDVAGEWVFEDIINGGTVTLRVR